MMHRVHGRYSVMFGGWTNGEMLKSMELNVKVSFNYVSDVGSISKLSNFPQTLSPKIEQNLTAASK